MATKLVALLSYVTTEEREAAHETAKINHETTSHMIGRLIREEQIRINNRNEREARKQAQEQAK